MRLERLSLANMVDFSSLFERDPCDKCYCMAWHRSYWDAFNPTIDQNRIDRQCMVERQIRDGYLIYDDARLVGWVQVARAASLPNLVDVYGDLNFQDEYAMTCFKIASAYRRRGYATAVVQAVVADIRTSGAQDIYAFPTSDPHFDEQEKWNGTKGMFAKNGFREIEVRGHYTIMKYDLKG